MRRLVPAALSLSALLALSIPALAMVIAPPALPQRVALAGCVVVGKVTNIEEKTVPASRFPGDPEKGEYRVAVVKVDEAVLGGKGLTHVRVGFQLPPPDARPMPTGGRPVLRRFRGVTLEKGQEACFFLAPHPEEPFYVVATPYDLLDKSSPEFGKELAEVRRAARMIADPASGLRSKDAGDRYMTAAMLLTRYRTPKPSAAPPRTEPVDAEQSKQILLALADADWSVAPRPGPGANRMLPQNLFALLGLTEKDGWKPPMDFAKFPGQARAWLNEHAGTYRIERFVTEKPGK
jgi:hypothetical protein